MITSISPPRSRRVISFAVRNSREPTAPGTHAEPTVDSPGAVGSRLFRDENDDRTPRQHPTVGFYGAIAEWFDADLVANLAELRPGWKFELIGSTLTGDVSRLEKLPNVALLGEKPYADLPRLVAAWDCFIIPFKRIPLTEATNPVKAYEMLATGKPVVAVNLPELRPMARDGLLAIADDAGGFAQAIDRALAEDDDRRRERRRAFAAENTWSDRCDAFDAGRARAVPAGVDHHRHLQQSRPDADVPGERLPRDRLSELRGDRGRQRLARRHGRVARRGGGAAAAAAT